jgi:hypothetical protein
MNDESNDQRIEIASGAAEEARLGLSQASPEERFIPVTRHDLLDRLSRPEVWGKEVEEIRTLFRVLVHWRRLEYSERQRQLVRDYHPFNPDADMKGEPLTEAHRQERQREFLRHIRHLLERGNYIEIPNESIPRLIAEQNPYGIELKVDLSEFEELLIYYRGQTSTIVKPNRLDAWVRRKKPVSLPIYQRLFVLLKLKPIELRLREIMKAENVDEKKAAKILRKLRKTLPSTVTGELIYLKLFKFIPRSDLEMLFPNTRVMLKSFDKLRLGITAGGGTTAGVVGTVSKLTAATAIGPVGWAVALAGLAGIIFRQVTSVFNARTQYMIELNRKLYFHSIANNRSVLAMLTEGGEEEDVKEEALLYTFLVNHPVHESELQHIKEGIEHFLSDAYGIKINFDMNDALARLAEDGLVKKDAGGVLTALRPTEAFLHIDHKWDSYLDAIAHAEGFNGND